MVEFGRWLSWAEGTARPFLSLAIGGSRRWRQTATVALVRERVSEFRERESEMGERVERERRWSGGFGGLRPETNLPFLPFPFFFFLWLK